MKFNLLVVNNFLSIGHLELPLDNRGLLLVVGENNDDPSAESNGSGKSSFIEAIYWCLYGKTLRGMKYVDSVVNRVNKKDCYVKLSMGVTNGEFVIERYRKHTEHKNSILVLLNGKDISSSDPRVTQNIIDRELGMDSDTFARLILIGQGFSFRYTDMSDKELKEFIEGLIGVNVFSDAYDKVKDKLYALKVEIVSSESKISSYDLQSSQLLGRISDEEKKANDLMMTSLQSIESLKGEIRVLEDALVDLKDKILKNDRGYEASLINLDSKIESLNDRIQVEVKKKESYANKIEEEKKSSLNKYTADVSTVIKERDAAVASVDAQIAQFNTAKTNMTKGKMDKVLSLRESLYKLESDHSRSIRGVEDVIRELSMQLQKLLSKTTINTLSSTLSVLEAKLEGLDAEILSVLPEDLGGKCPTCGQEINVETYKQHIISERKFESRRSSLVEEINRTKALISNEESVVDSGVRELTIQIEGKKATLDSLEIVFKANKEAIQNEINVLSDSPVEGLDKVEGFIQILLDSKHNLEDFYIIKLSGLEDDHNTRVELSESHYKPEIYASDVALSRYSDENKALMTEKLSISREKETKHLSLKEELYKIENSIREKRDRVLYLEKTDHFSSVMLLKSQVSDLERALEAENLKLAGLNADKYVLDYLSDAFGLGGIRSFVIDSVLTYLNDRIQVYSQELFDGNTRIYLSPVKQQKNSSLVEKITIEVTTDGGSYDASSGGEQRKVDVVLFLAFRDLSKSTSSISTNFEAYDEILSFLDGEAANRVIQLMLKDDTVSSRALITHRNDISIIGRHQIMKAIKKDGITEYLVTE